MTKEDEKKWLGGANNITIDLSSKKLKIFASKSRNIHQNTKALAFLNIGWYLHAAS